MDAEELLVEAYGEEAYPGISSRGRDWHEVPALSKYVQGRAASIIATTAGRRLATCVEVYQALGALLLGGPVNQRLHLSDPVYHAAVRAIPRGEGLSPQPPCPHRTFHRDGCPPEVLGEKILRDLRGPAGQD